MPELPHKNQDIILAIAQAVRDYTYLSRDHTYLSMEKKSTIVVSA
ncbi:hypothetical protein [Leptolyngbya sp. CCY15150]|nr:hypothetical protein [Leptolyngbya sp. CCY15150]